MSRSVDTPDMNFLQMSWHVSFVQATLWCFSPLYVSPKGFLLVFKHKPFQKPCLHSTCKDQHLSSSFWQSMKYHYSFLGQEYLKLSG